MPSLPSLCSRRWMSPSLRPVRYYENELRKRNWSEAAKYLNGLNEGDIQRRLQRLGREGIQAIHDGAVANSEVGTQSQLAILSERVLASLPPTPTPRPTP